MSTETMTKIGREYFEDTYGDTAASVQSMLDAYFPDLGEYQSIPRIESTFCHILI